METPNSTFYAIELCNCGRLQAKHVWVVLDGAVFHPIHSKKGIESLVRAQEVDVGMGETDMREIIAYAENLDLPESSLIFDLAAPHLESTDIEGSGLEARGSDGIYDQHKGKAFFEMCFFCYDHGILVDRKQNILARPKTKYDAREALHEAIMQGQILVEDEPSIKDQISDCSYLEEGGPKIKSNESKARFNVCSRCGEHGDLIDKDGEAVEYNLRTKKDALRALMDALWKTGQIDKSDQDRIMQEIMSSKMENGRR